MKNDKATKPRKEDLLNPALLPDWAPYLCIRDLAILWRTTPAAIRKALETPEDKLGTMLKKYQRDITTHRRLFDRQGIMAEIKGQTAENSEKAAVASLVEKALNQPSSPLRKKLEDWKSRTENS